MGPPSPIDSSLCAIYVFRVSGRTAAVVFSSTRTVVTLLSRRVDLSFTFLWRAMVLSGPFNNTKHSAVRRVFMVKADIHWAVAVGRERATRRLGAGLEMKRIVNNILRHKEPIDDRIFA